MPWLILGVGAVLAYVLYARVSRAVSLEEENNVSAQANIAAFLRMIRYAEGTYDDAGYHRLFGGGSFDDLSQHPGATGWKVSGEFLHVGETTYTTAAGAYQITYTTYKRVAPDLDISDFSEDSQDAIAKELIRQAGAMEDVIAGNFENAVKSVSGIWASMPYASAPQPHQSYAKLSQIYLANGGTIASV
jgi:muramidase (phage lysozyme)